MKTITPFELQMVIDKGPVELIDVRPKKDFEKVHALGARSIPLSDLEPHSVLAHRKLDRHAPLYLMCRQKTLATLAACSLASAGLDEPIVVEGGLEAWEEQCLPVVRKNSWRMPVMDRLRHLGAVTRFQASAQSALRCVPPRLGAVRQDKFTSHPDSARSC